jgi:hypothetical protein
MYQLQRTFLGGAGEKSLRNLAKCHHRQRTRQSVNTPLSPDLAFEPSIATVSGDYMA